MHGVRYKSRPALARSLRQDQVNQSSNLSQTLPRYYTLTMLGVHLSLGLEGLTDTAHHIVGAKLLSATTSEFRTKSEEQLCLSPYLQLLGSWFCRVADPTSRGTCPMGAHISARTRRSRYLFRIRFVSYLLGFTLLVMHFAAGDASMFQPCVMQGLSVVDRPRASVIYTVSATMPTTWLFLLSILLDWTNTALDMELCKTSSIESGAPLGRGMRNTYIGLGAIRTAHACLCYGYQLSPESELGWSKQDQPLHQ